MNGSGARGAERSAPRRPPRSSCRRRRSGRAPRPQARLTVGLVLATLWLGSCGGSGVEGTYTCPDNETLELRDDGTFVGIDADQRFEGTYAVEDDIVFFVQEDGNTTDGILQEDGSIQFGGGTVCVKQ